MAYKVIGVEVNNKFSLDTLKNLLLTEYDPSDINNKNLINKFKYKCEICLTILVF